MVKRIRTAALAGILGLGVAGCSDPTADKPAAIVSEPASVPGPEVDGNSDPAGTATEVPSDPSSVAGGGLSFDGTGSKIGFVGSKIVGGSHDGGFKDFKGTLVLSEDGKALRAVSAVIDMKSTFSDNEKLTAHLMNADFFEVETYPEARFESSEIKADPVDPARSVVIGNFTLHGVTKTIEFPATISVGESEVSLVSEFSIKRGDFGIVYGNLGDNAIRDEVLIKLALKATRAS